MEKPILDSLASDQDLRKYFLSLLDSLLSVTPTNWLPDYDFHHCEQRLTPGSPHLTTARVIRDEIRHVVDQRDSFLTENDLDSSLFLPSGLWGAAELGVPCHGVLNHLENTVGQLRPVSMQFTGVPLLPTKPGADPLSDPSAYDASFAHSKKGKRLAAKYVRRFKALTERAQFTIRPPPTLGEAGWSIGETIVNHDTCAYQERINLLSDAGIIDWMRARIESRGHCRILEIGSGYGALAHYIREIIPEVEYMLVDIPESLVIASMYLGLVEPGVNHFRVFPKDGVFPQQTGAIHYVANYRFGSISAVRFPVDLAINTLSFSEMTEAQARFYARGVSKLIGKQGILFEQNQDNRHVGGLRISDVLKEEFRHKVSVKAKSAPTWHGQPNLWSCAPLQEILAPHSRSLSIPSEVDLSSISQM